MLIVISRSSGQILGTQTRVWAHTSFIQSHLEESAFFLGDAGDGCHLHRCERQTLQHETLLSKVIVDCHIASHMHCNAIDSHE